jgi:hypothetical protein
MLNLLNDTEKTLAIDTTGVPIRVKAYRIPPERITKGFGMTVLLLMETEGEATYGASSRAWISEATVNGRPHVIIVVYKHAVA